MKVKFDIIGLCLSWFAIIAQFVLMLQNRQTDIPEMIIRYFSFFTILTNILVALYFTTSVFKLQVIPFKLFHSTGSITAITAFILIVGLVYQVVLRKTWQPTGLQRMVDELLHSVIPLYVLIYWFFKLNKNDLLIKPILKWLLYPILYLLFILLRGNNSGFYPYPFVNVPKIGLEKALVNSAATLLLAIILLIVLILIGRVKYKKFQKVQL